MRSAQTMEQQRVKPPASDLAERILRPELILSLLLLLSFVWVLMELTATASFDAGIFSQVLTRGDDASWGWMSVLFFLIPVLAILTIALTLIGGDNKYVTLAAGTIPFFLFVIVLLRAGVPGYSLMGTAGGVTLLISLVFAIVALARVPDVGSQVALIGLTAVVVFPILWIIGMALDPRDLPAAGQIIPDQLSLAGFERLFTEPLINEQPVWTGLRNSLMAAGGTAILATVVGTSAAYAFSRFRFPGRQAGMLGFIAVQIMPSVTTLAPLFVILNSVRIGDWVLRQEVPGLIIAYSSGALPFVIWMLKGYFDTIPKDLEEAALIDGAGPLQAFFKVVAPLSLPAFAVTLLFAFMAGWSEYLLAVIFMNKPENMTLPIMLQGMVNQYGSAPWSDFASLSILMALPIVALFFLLQRWIVSGLTIGGVKG